ncbi:MAG TPA: hypothetical protein VLK33_17530, partial [Terriglobales bacterium]|nr:hypothetical protein [Terriglobales bacterium]
MVLPNPKTTYKAQLLDYDALLLASEDECSYCLSEREIQMLLAFVDYIGWKTRYIATETEIDTVLIQQWGNNLARKLMSGCCGEELHRFTPEGVYQSSEDDGATWQDDFDGDPRNAGTAAPPLSGAASSSKRCAAADNVRDLFEQYRDNLIEIVGATPTILAIIAGILGFIGTVLGLSGVGTAIGVLFLTMAAEMIQIGGTGISGAITFTALENFRCLVYCRMNNDGELTYDAWKNLLVDIAAEFDGFAETFFYQTVNGMGHIGVNNAATIGAATADDCEDCDCALSCDSPDDLASKIEYGTVTATGIYSGHPGVEVESEFAGGTNVVRWGTIGSAAPPNMCCYFTDYVVLEGEVLSTYWTDCSGG